MTEEIPVKEQVGGQLSTPAKETGILDTSAPARARRNAGITREEAIRRLETFHRLTRIIAASNHSVPRMLEAVARLVSDALGDSTTITRLNADGETYHIAAFFDADPEYSARFKHIIDESSTVIPRDQGAAAAVIATGTPLLLPMVSADQAAEWAVPAFIEYLRDVGIASLLVVPIRGRGGVLGTIAVTRHGGGRHYDNSDRDFLTEVGYRVGVAMEDFTLVESLRNEVGARLFAREALAASEQRFLSVFRSSPLGIVLMDLVGNVLEANPAYQAVSGFAEDDLIAMHFYDIIHPDDVTRVLDTFTLMKISPEPQASIEHRVIRRDGSTLWVTTTFAAVRKGLGDERLSLIFGITEDLTKRKQSEIELQELRQHLQQNIELERLRLAQNLHDTPLQELYAVIYKLEALRTSIDPVASELIAGVIDDIQKTLNNLRTTASELRPPALSRFGLEKAIRSYAQDFREKHPELKVELALARDRQALPEPVRLVLFRVMQEALANIARHARATEIHIRFSFDAEEARLEISDNGTGFTVPDNWMNVVREGHYGLAGMAERIQAARGTLSLESSPGGSTTIRATVPCMQ